MGHRRNSFIDAALVAGGDGGAAPKPAAAPKGKNVNPYATGLDKNYAKEAAKKRKADAKLQKKVAKAGTPAAQTQQADIPDDEPTVTRGRANAA